MFNRQAKSVWRWPALCRELGTLDLFEVGKIISFCHFVFYGHSFMVRAFQMFMAATCNEILKYLRSKKKRRKAQLKDLVKAGCFI